MFILIYHYPDLSSFKLSPAVELDVRNRVVSFIHGIVALLICGYHILFTFTECGEQTVPAEYLVLVISGGYFTYDLLAMAWLGLLDIDMTIHHLLCAVGILISLRINVGTGYFVLGLFVAEVSNPSMHIRVMLRNLGMRYTKSYEVAEYLYFATFFFGRVVIG